MLLIETNDRKGQPVHLTITQRKPGGGRSHNIETFLNIYLTEAQGKLMISIVLTESMRKELKNFL